MLSFVLDRNLGLPAIDRVAYIPTATGLDDLAGADYGYINTACTSSYFSPAILLTPDGKPWEIRATIVLEAVWKSFHPFFHDLERLPA